MRGSPGAASRAAPGLSITGSCTPRGQPGERYSERRKLRMSCWSDALKALNCWMTALASDWQATPSSVNCCPGKQKGLLLWCARIAFSSPPLPGPARPSWRKKIRCPRPQRGAVRNSSGPATPCFTKSASPGPMLCRATSLNGWKVTSPIPVNGDFAVVSDDVWQRTQPIPGFELVPNNAWPCSSEGVLVVGLGGAVNRMNSSNLTASEDIPVAVPDASVLMPLS